MLYLSGSFASKSYSLRVQYRASLSSCSETCSLWLRPLVWSVIWSQRIRPLEYNNYKQISQTAVTALQTETYIMKHNPKWASISLVFLWLILNWDFHHSYLIQSVSDKGLWWDDCVSQSRIFHISISSWIYNGLTTVSAVFHKQMLQNLSENKWTWGGFSSNRKMPVILAC